MDIFILFESAIRVDFSNGDIINESQLYAKGSWWLDKKERRDAEEDYYKKGGEGVVVTSWRLINASCKEEALKKYQEQTGNKITAPPKLNSRYDLIKKDMAR
jgi:hypothetical protein